MKKITLSTGAALACACLLNSCGFISYESGEGAETEIELINEGECDIDTEELSEDEGTEIELLGEAECDIDTVMNKPNYSKGQGWLIMNTGTETLCIDSVIPSSDRIQLVYPNGTQTVKKKYQAHWTSIGVGGTKTHNVCKETHMIRPTDTEPGEYLPIRAMLHPAEGEEGPFSYSIMVYGNFPDSPLELTLEGEYVIAD